MGACQRNLGTHKHSQRPTLKIGKKEKSCPRLEYKYTHESIVIKMNE